MSRVAIRDMWVRGAPLIGVTAAYGDGDCQALDDAVDAALDAAWETLHETRPTAINLRWALDWMRDCAEAACRKTSDSEAAYGMAAGMAEEDVELNRAIGQEWRCGHSRHRGRQEARASPSIS